MHGLLIAFYSSQAKTDNCACQPHTVYMYYRILANLLNASLGKTHNLSILQYTLWCKPVTNVVSKDAHCVLLHIMPDQQINIKPRSFAIVSDESFTLQELCVYCTCVHTHCVEKKPLLSLLSTKCSSGSKESSGGQQMMLKLYNKVFSAKAKRQKP